MTAKADFQLRLMTRADYDSAISLWQACDGIGLRHADSPASFQHFLTRNPETCFVAFVDEVLIGTVLASEDGRRGYLYHLAVSPIYRGVGCGRALVEQALAAIHARGIDKCHIHVFKDNSQGREFWRKLGWQERQETLLMSFTRTDDPNA